MIVKYCYCGKAMGGNVSREEDPAFGKKSVDAFGAYPVVVVCFVY